jgi:small subunit ribosomal protein S4e
MHLRRQAVPSRVPLKRKGTKYVVRASSDVRNAVPVLLAVRDMLKLAKTAKEVKSMIKRKLLKLNGRIVLEEHQAIKLFDVFEADKVYRLIILPTNKFSFEETNQKSQRITKVISRRLVRDGKIQLNLHDGSNVLSSSKISVGDTLLIDFSGKIKDHIPLEKGKRCFVLSGKYVGLEGKIETYEKNKVKVSFNNKEEATINQSQVVAL